MNLTEFPSVILGSFDPEFLALPEEVLVTVMRDHQKYFALEEPTASCCRTFSRCSTPTAIPTGIIRHGNERVLRARFNDARFFWQTDQKTSAARARGDAEDGYFPERPRQLLRQDAAACRGSAA